MDKNQNPVMPALERIQQTHPVIQRAKRGLPHPGSRPDQKPFTYQLQTIHRAYLDGNEVYSQSWDPPSDMKAFNIGNGSPLRQAPFPFAVEEACYALRSPEISQYAFASGDLECRRRVAAYLTREGVRSNSKDETVTETQVIFFNSTTEAFSLLMKVICRPGDVVLFAAPTYGLLAYAPERVGAMTRFVNLNAEDRWLINPQILEDTILNLNRELKDERERYGYEPCVTAFVNINPNNPTGLVMGEQERPLLEQLNALCARNSVLLIDDIIYRDLSYTEDHLALPAAAIPGYFSNIVTLFGTSKCYGFAGARAGAIAADECIIRGLRNELFRLMDSTPLTVSHLMAGAFNTDEDRDRCYRSYFSTIRKKYERNWHIVKTVIDGQSTDWPLEPEEERLIRERFAQDADAILKTGIPKLSVACGIQPESGFFALVDFTRLLGLKDRTGQRLCSEMDILYYFFKTVNIKMLTGESFAWPIQGQIVSRVSFAYEPEDLMRMLYQLFQGISALTEEP